MQFEAAAKTLTFALILIGKIESPSTPFSSSPDNCRSCGGISVSAHLRYQQISTRPEIADQFDRPRICALARSNNRAVRKARGRRADFGRDRLEKPFRLRAIASSPAKRDRASAELADTTAAVRCN